MHRLLVWAVAFFLLVAVVSNVLIGSTEFVFHHPSQPAGIRFVSQNGRVVAQTLPVVPEQLSGGTNNHIATARTAPASRSSHPQAVAEVTRFHFGTLNPNAVATHTFSVRNEGDAPLRLKAGETTCKCTLSEVAAHEIEPGEVGEVTLEWTTPDHSTYFGHSATVYTNDPHLPELTFHIEGKVRVLFATKPEQGVILHDLVPGREKEVDVLLYSEIWEAFSVTDVQLIDLPEFGWEIIHDSSQSFGDAIRSSATLKIVAPPMPASGRSVNGRVRLTVLPVAPNETGSTEPWHVEIPVRASAAGRLTVYGEAIDANGVVDLGRIAEGDGAEASLTVKVRDEAPALDAVRVRTFPSFLQASFAPHKTGGAMGLYRLEIKVPPNAPPCSYSEATPGEVLVEFDHARIQSLRLKITFSVMK